jgi:hypothetical protein
VFGQEEHHLTRRWVEQRTLLDGLLDAVGRHIAVAIAAALAVVGLVLDHAADDAPVASWCSSGMSGNGRRGGGNGCGPRSSLCPPLGSLVVVLGVGKLSRRTVGWLERHLVLGEVGWGRRSLGEAGVGRGRL